MQTKTSSICNTYPKEYEGPKPIDDQILEIAKIFSLDSAQALEHVKNLSDLPDHAEGWFAIPSVEALAKRHFPEVTDPRRMYCLAIQCAHKKISDSRDFHNYHEGQIAIGCLRVHARTARALDLITKKQPGDILVIAAQLGMRHRRHDVRRARDLFIPNEFGLGSFAVSSIILTHPNRLVRWEELHMDCAGDELAPGADGDFSAAPSFRFVNDEIHFGSNEIDFGYERYGSVSGFIQ